MAISMDRITVGANESIFVNIQGSSERCVIIQVSRSGRCFVTAPFNNKRKIFELLIEGLRETTEEARNEAVNSL